MDAWFEAHNHLAYTVRVLRYIDEHGDGRMASATLDGYRARLQEAEQALTALETRFYGDWTERRPPELPLPQDFGIDGAERWMELDAEQRARGELPLGLRLLAYEAALRERVEGLRPRLLEESGGITTRVTTLSDMQRLPEAQGELERFYAAFPELRPAADARA